MLEYVDRKGTSCSKWDGLSETFGAADLLPLWVADMDFKVDKAIAGAVSDYLEAGVFGYYTVPAGYYEAFIEWEKSEHGFTVDQEWIGYSPGVVSGFNFAVQVLTDPGDAIIVNTPVYYPFLHAVENNGRRLICSELINDDGRYYIDFEDFERRITDNNVRAFILCSPHNPVSRVWSADELRHLLDICRRHDVAVISDEIHHDLTFGGAVHTPTLSVAEENDRIIMFTSASKTFNLAAFKNSFAVIRDPELKSEWDSFMKGLRISGGNPLGYIAAEAAFRYSKPWLEELRAVVQRNYDHIKSEFALKLPEVRLTPLEATYLAWADFGAYFKPEELQPFMQDKCGLAFDYGDWFGGDRSGSFIRINLATSYGNIDEMIKRIVESLSE